MIPILLGLGGLIVTGAVLEEIDEQKQKSAPTVKEEFVTGDYVRDHFAKSGRKIRKVGD